MAITRAIPLAVCLVLAGVASALPLTLTVDVSSSRAQQDPPAQNCLIGTKPCANLSSKPASPCLVGTRTCLRNGKLVALASAPPRKQVGCITGRLVRPLKDAAMRKPSRAQPASQALSPQLLSIKEVDGGSQTERRDQCRVVGLEHRNQSTIGGAL